MTADERTPARQWDWRLIVVTALAIVPMAGVFTTSRIFFVRDLGLFFFSRHVWVRHTLLGGTAPFWDPYVAGGQAAMPDALNQLLMPITLAIRLLPSDVVSFNVWVALPLPIAAIGMYRFLRARHGDDAAFVGSVAFALSGPVVSMLNTPNLSWSVAFIPWVLLCADRLLAQPTFGRGCTLAIVFALQALSGEPVTMAATAAVVAITSAYSWRDGRWSSPGATAVVIAFLAAGTLLAAGQLLPTMRAGVAAHRAAQSTPDFWSLHPLALLEAVAPHVFGNYYNAFLADMPWMTPLNSGREPFYYSLYVGPLVLLLAASGAIARPRRNAAWLVLGALFLVFAMGGYTPVYPVLRKLFPALAFFRFPVKYITITAVALAVLTADGWDAITDPLLRRRVTRVAIGAAAIAIACGLVLVAAVVFVGPSLAIARSLAARVQVDDVDAGAHFLLRVAPPLLARGVALLIAGTGLLILAAGNGPRARHGAILLIVALCADLIVLNAGLNPTSSVEKMTPPSWYRALASSQRVYIGGRLRGYMNPKDPDASIMWEIPAEFSAVEGRLELNSELPMAPSGWGVREAVSYDLPVLWPSAYEMAMGRFERANAAQRSAFLRRSGVRWCVIRADPDVSDDRRVFVQHWSMALYDCDPAASRVFLALGDVAAAADPRWQQDALFDLRLPDTVLRLDRIPELTGTGVGSAPPSAALVTDGANEVVVRASLPREGYLVLRDSYDPSWRATIDGARADIARANGLYRAVRVPSGRHVIRFEYRPRDVMAGLSISGGAAVLLAGGVLARRRRRPRIRTAREGGFTLIELMIVIAIIAILMAVAIARYVHMHRNANEAAAVVALRTIARAEWEFAQTCGHQHYSPSLTGLGQPTPTTGEPFLSPDLTAADEVEKSGYLIRITAKVMPDVVRACNSVQVSEGYAATADPTRPGLSGETYFGMNADRIVYGDAEKTFKDDLEESGPPKHGVEVK